MGTAELGCCAPAYHGHVVQYAGFVGVPATKLMHPKYTNAKYVFLYIIIYEKHDFHGSQAKLATYSCLFNINVEKHRKFGPVTPKI